MLYRNFSSNAELDAAYDVEKSVPDFPSYLERFEQGNIKARAAFDHQMNVRIGPSLDERVDIFPATGADGKPPIIVFVHGGYWRLSDGNDYNYVASGLSQHAALCIPNYTLAPYAPMWEIVRQVRASVAWAWNNADRLGGDRDRIYVVGHSAGAHLAVMASLTDWAGEYGLPRDIIKGTFAISGLYDLRPLPYTLVGPALQLSYREILDLSPMLRELPGSAPNLRISYGGLEPAEFVRQSEHFLARWKDAGLPGNLSIHPDKNHFSIILDLNDPQSDVVREIADFLRR